MPSAKVGDRVCVQYARVKERPAVAGKPADRKPADPKTLEFTVGSREVMSGLSLGVVGMAQGEEKLLTLQPTEAYGPVKPGLIKEIPRHQFPKHLVLRVGKRLTALGGTSGRRRQVRVVEINPKSVLVDGNHLLAGKVVELQVRLISVDSTAAAKSDSAKSHSAKSASAKSDSAKGSASPRNRGSSH